MKKMIEKNSIFKYASLRTAKLILENNEVLLNKPLEFNDPYDSRILFEEIDLKIARNIVLNYSADIAIKKVLKEHIHELPFRQKLIAYPATLTLRLSDYSNKRFKEYKPTMNFTRWISLFSKLGLKNGIEGSTSQKALEEFIQLKESKKIEEGIKYAVTEASNQLLVSCFSKVDDSVLMWSHYADSNRGVCLEFENEDFLDVSYSNERAAIRMRNLMYKILWNFHNKEKIEITKNNLPMMLIAIAPLLTKSNDWAYEKEVRCILSKSNSKAILKDDKYFYMMKNIKSITLGCRVSLDDKNKLIEIAEENSIPIFEMVLSKDTYTLTKKPILLLEVISS